MNRRTILLIFIGLFLAMGSSAHESAYVRFASVYRQFEDPQEFMAELRDLLETRK